MSEDIKNTIAAIATPKGVGGIGIIRISGAGGIKAAMDIFVSKDLKERKSFIPRYLYNGFIRDKDKKIIDEVLLVYMKGPNSYTAEDVVEIQAHAGFYVLKTILETLFDMGIVPAKPGEFTKRAYLNGRIDLTQAEAVIDVINAETEKSHKAALNIVTGKISKDINRIRKIVEGLITKFEAVLDFPEDVGDIISSDEIADTLKEDVENPLKTLIGNYENGHLLRDGVKLAIVGVPNVGKSSLMNRLINKERAIVTHIPGTTRDLIEEPFNLNGIPVVITDTAGIHETCDPVETIGIERTNDAIESADLVLFVVDGSKKVSEDDLFVFKRIEGKKTVIVINKSDILDETHKKDNDHFPKSDKVFVSAKSGEGIIELKKKINDLSIEGIGESDDLIIPNLRQKKAMERSVELIGVVLKGLESELPFEMISMDLKDIHEILGEILGITEKTDFLDGIFSDFCIGK